MSAVAELALVNACTALAFACAAAAATLRIRRPAIAHLLWLVVLAELLAPPVIAVGVLPRPEALSSSSAPDLAGSPETVVAGLATTVPDADAATPSPSPSPEAWLLAIWLAGSLAIAALAAMRGRRFVRLLGEAMPATPQLNAQVGTLARRLGLARPPRLRIVDARVSPLVWKLGRSTELVLPAPLLDRLAPRELDAVLAHELAHLRRRDHWTRWLELAAGIAFWWHPVSWWARARLRRLEERSCDDLVLLTFPHLAADYARGLLATLELLARSERPVPALACGFGAHTDMKERLTMILHRSPLPPLRRTHHRLLALALVSSVLVFPTWAERADDETPGRPSRAAEVERQALHEALAQLEQQTAQLQAALGELRARQADLERRLLGNGTAGVEAGRAWHETDEALRRELELELELERQHARARDEAVSERQRALEEELAALARAEREHEREATDRARALLEEALMQERQRDHRAEELRAVAEQLRSEGLEDEARELERLAEELEGRGTGTR
jgi:beta-lactamase regulating signal transducer with metallopeptidase domain